MEHGQRLVFCHVDLVQNPEAPLSCTLADGSLSKDNLPVLQSIRADQRRGIYIDIEGYIPGRSSECCGQILCQHVFSRRLGSRQQNIFTAQQRGGRSLPNLFSIIQKPRLRNTPSSGRVRRIRVMERTDFFQQHRVHTLLFQLHPHIHQTASLYLCLF